MFISVLSQCFEVVFNDKFRAVKVMAVKDKLMAEIDNVFKQMNLATGLYRLQSITGKINE